MKQVLIPENQIADFELLTEKNRQDCLDINYILCFLLDGELDITTADASFHMKEEDLLFIDTYTTYSWHARDPILLARFGFCAHTLASYYDLDALTIVCSNEQRDNSAYHALQELLRSCIPYYKGKCANDGRSRICLNSLYYQIIALLFGSFALYSGQERNVQDTNTMRMQEILRYIHANFRRPISLHDLAERTHLSEAYVSRYIKKNLGRNLGDYLTQLRLDAAIQELTGTSKTIAQIALDNGFANITAFNLAFKKRCGQTPDNIRSNYPALRMMTLTVLPLQILPHIRVRMT